MKKSFFSGDLLNVCLSVHPSQRMGWWFCLLISKKAGSYQFVKQTTGSFMRCWCCRCCCCCCYSYFEVQVPTSLWSCCTLLKSSSHAVLWRGATTLRCSLLSYAINEPPPAHYSSTLVVMFWCLILRCSCRLVCWVLKAKRLRSEWCGRTMTLMQRWWLAVIQMRCGAAWTARLKCGELLVNVTHRFL